MSVESETSRSDATAAASDVLTTGVREDSVRSGHSLFKYQTSDTSEHFWHLLRGNQSRPQTHCNVSKQPIGTPVTDLPSRAVQPMHS